MKNIGIMGAMDLEIEMIEKNMECVKIENIAGFKYYVGKVGNRNIVLTCCGVGKVNAACCTQILIDKFKVDAIINTGIAGGLNGDVKVCDLVISDNVTHHDVKKAQMLRCFPFKEYFESDRKLIELAVEACKLNTDENWNYHIGRIVSGENFVSDNVLKNNIINEYSPHCVEMEGAAIGHVAYLNNIPFVVIRCISDNADDDAQMSYDDFETIAANKSATVVINIIKNS